MHIIGVELTADAFTITSGRPSELMRYSVSVYDAVFPNTAQLWVDRAARMGGLDYLAFSPTHLWDIARAQGKTPARMDKPLVVAAETELKPMVVTVDGDAGYRALLMPVRIDRT